jgi:phage tail-like protein
MKNIVFTIAAFLLFAAAAFGQNSTADWPTQKFRFEVEYTVEGKTYKFEVQEVSGLEVEAQPIEYRTGNSKEYSVQKMPGIKKFSDVTLKKGVFVKDNTFFEWQRSIRVSSNAPRATVVVRLLDEDGNPTMVWTLKNAFPNKISGFNENAGSFETLVLSNEGITVKEQ